MDFSNEKQAMLLLTGNYVNKLSGIWEQTFHPDIYKKNFHKLIKHATLFYDELVQESLSRRAIIEDAIKVSKEQADNLKGLLNTEVQLPSFETNAVSLVVVQSEWEKCVNNLTEQLRMRKEQVCKLMLEQKSLCEELCEPAIMLLTDPLPTTLEMENFVKHLQNLREEREQRLNKVYYFRKEIKDFLEMLQMKAHSEQDDVLLNNKHIKVNKETVNQLERMHTLYKSQVKQLQTTIEYMRKKLHTFWEHNQTSPSTRSKFDCYIECNRNTYDALWSELQRCESLRSQNIKFFVQQIRDKITTMWEKTLKTEKEKNCFTNFTSTCYNRELLAEHEVELENLNLFYETNKEIFELFADRNILWDRMNALEVKASDPSRFNNRGGHLLKEEKERKTIDIKLPKVEQQILELAKIYEEREHKPFMVYGENIIDFMLEQWEKKRVEKELLQKTRRNAKPTTPSSSATNMRTPTSWKKASATNSLQKSPSAMPSYKWKMSLKDKHSPVAKRALNQSFNSPKVSLQPVCNETIRLTNRNSAKKIVNKKLNKSDSKLSLKKTKVIATTIRRYSSNQKQRRSGNNAPPATVVPNIVIDHCPSSDGYITDNDNVENY